ncbi:NACHT domain-containing protein [Saccharopolyspora cebuensis]|uniref:NACHT domain-containing NTPase n=1 Tax=Saccharopolyspora cebuensis TaxID=418759 RepID=A0ABV4CEZ6_9PSEU
MFVGVVAWLILRVMSGNLEHNDQLGSVVSMFVGLASLLATVVSTVVAIRQNKQQRTAASTETLDDLLANVAAHIHRDCEEEERIRKVHDPFPLGIRWTGAPEHLFDHWQSINGSLGNIDQVPLTGYGIDELIDVFQRIPSGRLVILGKAGSGKTLMASRLAVTVLDRRPRAETEPIPVIFPLSSWDPGVESLRTWLLSYLHTEFPALAVGEPGRRSIAEQLLSAGRVLPILDGFDEIAKGKQATAMKAINAALGPRLRLIVTSRPQEYADAVESSDVITAAAAIQLCDLDLDDVAAYLPLTVRKRHLEWTRTKWHPVIDRIRDETDDAGRVVATVFRTPLMVSLARTIFSETNADPQRLLETPHELTMPERCALLEDQLLAGFIPAAYGGQSHETATGRRESPPDVKRIQRQFQFLARHLAHQRTYDLAWWRLVLALPRSAVGTVAGIAFLLPSWAVVVSMWWSVGTFAAMEMPSMELFLAVGFAFGAVFSAVLGIMVGLGRGLRPSPLRMRLRIRQRWTVVYRRILSELGPGRWKAIVWLGLCTSGGLTFGTVGAVMTGALAVALLGIGAGAMIGIGLWLVVIIVRSLSVPVELTDINSPRELLDLDRRTTLFQGATVGGLGSLLAWLIFRSVFEATFVPSVTEAFGPFFLPIAWLATAAGGMLVWLLLITVWGPWSIARFLLPLTGQLPWPIMRFLNDAHRRGVLRKTGGVYQFRHARLRDHLSRAHSDGTAVLDGSARSREEDDQAS